MLLDGKITTIGTFRIMATCKGSKSLKCRIQHLRTNNKIPISRSQFDDICNQVARGNRYGDFAAQLLNHDRNVNEKIARKTKVTDNKNERVKIVLDEWWKKVHDRQDAIIDLYRALAEIDLKNLADSIFPNVLDHIKIHLHSSIVSEVAERCWKSAGKWRRLANCLHLSNAEIRHVDTSNRSNKDRVKRVLALWEESYNGYPTEKLAVLLKACRECGSNTLANEIEQGLDVNAMEFISRMVDENNWKNLAGSLDISQNVLYVLENACKNAKTRVFHLLKCWSQCQPFSVHKLTVVSSALDACQLNHVSRDICRGLDNDQLEYLVKKLLHLWQNLAEWLGLTQTDIDNIATRKGPSNDKCREVFEIWRKRQPASCDLLGELAMILKEHDEFVGLANYLVEGLHETEVDTVAGKIGNKWQEVANCLGFDQKDIDVTTAGLLHERENPEKAYRILCRYRYRSRQGRVMELIRCLKECDLQPVALDLATRIGTPCGATSGPRESLCSNCALAEGSSEQQSNAIDNRKASEKKSPHQDDDTYRLAPNNGPPFNVDSKDKVQSLVPHSSSSRSRARGAEPAHIPCHKSRSTGHHDQEEEVGLHTSSHGACAFRENRKSQDGRTDDGVSKLKKSRSKDKSKIEQIQDLQPQRESTSANLNTPSNATDTCSENRSCIAPKSGQTSETSSEHDKQAASSSRCGLQNNIAKPSNEKSGDWDPFLKTLARIVHPIWKTVAEKLKFSAEDIDKFEKKSHICFWWPSYKMLSDWRGYCEAPKRYVEFKQMLAETIVPLDRKIADKVLAVTTA
ncbi:uncharacterized protein [Amphiura filiformis]|uniref:uncharacterized protein n=1 Tax=Amphiura filiformis TaxID=82378 RepID=UPI003B219321